MNVEFIQVESSNVDQIGWNDGALYVKFKNGSIYQYDGVPEDTFTEMKDAPSVGSFLSQNVKGVFTFTRIQ